LIGQHSTVAYPFLPDPAALQASRLKVFSRLVDLMLRYAFLVS